MLRLLGVCVAGKLAPVIDGAGLHAAGLTVIVPVPEVISLLQREGVGFNVPRNAERKPARTRKKGRKR